MPSQAKNKFLENKKDINELWAIHEEVAGLGPGRKYGVEVLNRACIVFITACWESYIEDLAAEAFDCLLANAQDAKSIPPKVRAFSSKVILDQKDATKLWVLADAGWRGHLMAHKESTLKNWLGGFNTPKVAQVNNLYVELLGIPKLSDAWYWAGINAASVEKKLDEFIQLRGDIAHRLKSSTAVNKFRGTSYLSHVSSIVDCCEKKVAEHLSAQTGVAPW
jgi:hypothetical protein